MKRDKKKDDRVRASILSSYEETVPWPRKKFHRDAKEIPKDPAQQKSRIRWVQNHHVWQYPVKTKKQIPSDINKMFKKRKDGYSELVFEKCPERIVWMGDFRDCVEIDLTYVSPKTHAVEHNDRQNTLPEIWIEAGPWYDQSKDKHIPKPDGGWTKYNKWCKSHDVRLDCGGKDLIEAILELASRVEFFYNKEGKDRKNALKHCKGYFKDDDIRREMYVSTCEADKDGYCKKCGFEVP